MQAADVKLIPTSSQAWQVHGLSPIQQLSILTSVWISWRSWGNGVCTYGQITVRAHAHIIYKVVRYGFERWIILEQIVMDGGNHLCRKWTNQAIISCNGFGFRSTNHNRTSRRNFSKHLYWLVGAIVNGILNLLVIQRLNSIHIHLIPYILVGLQVKLDRFGEIEFYSSLASILISHIDAPIQLLVSSHLQIYLSHILMNKLANHIKDETWATESDVHIARQWQGTLGSNIILATNSSTEGYMGLSFWSSKSEARQTTHIAEELVGELIPLCTFVLIQLATLHLYRILASEFIHRWSSCFFCLCFHWDLLLGNQSYI